MINWLFRFVFKLMGWKLNRELPEGMEKCVMIAAPHTSNRDFVYMSACFDLLNLPVRYTIKSEFKKFPLKQILGPLGAIWIDRTPKKPGDPRPSLVDVMIDLFNDRDSLVIAVTPEGTRSKRTKWKSGFYHVAVGANVPIALGYLDFKNKVAGVGKMVHPSGDYEKDMREIMAFYKDIQPKYPKKFSIDLRFVDEA